MTQGAIFIGVDRTGNLPVLSDAAAGAARLHAEWHAHYRLGPSILLTDAEQPVGADDVQRAIEQILAPANLDQLVIYFAGHGVNVRMSEYWLLSDAPRRAQAAVNVRGSEHLARYCGVPHVTFISDACRTAADTINAQNVTGTDIFPNEQLTDTERSVDLFFSCALGKPAHEARDVTETSRLFKGIYTNILCSALCFREPDLVDWVQANGEAIGYVRPRRLRDFLSAAVPRRIRELGLESEIMQRPDAHISSEPEAWLSRQVGGPVASPAPGRSAFPMRATRSFDFRPPPNPATVARMRLNATITNVAEATRALGIAAPPGRRHFDTHCGFNVSGAQVKEAWALGARLRQRPGLDGGVQAEVTLAGSASILLVLENGCGVVLPMIAEYIATLTVAEGELIDVAYEPSEGTSRGARYRATSQETRTLRKVTAEAASYGMLRVGTTEAELLAHRMLLGYVMDPALSIYAAYAYDELHRRELITQLDRALELELSASLFDVAMLAGRLDRRTVSQRAPVLGVMPLFSQGWATLRARRIGLPDGCEDIDQMVTDSLWTTFTPAGVDRLRSTLFRAAVPWQVA